MKAEELVVMASLECSPAEAVAELARWEPALINLAHPVSVGSGVVKASTLNVRERPRATAKVVGKVTEAALVTIWGQTPAGDWYAIEEPAGWVASAWVAT